MSQQSIQTIRNIGIIAHIDAGKTTVTERMLYCSGAIHRVGEVDRGNTETDFDAEEQERGITIYAACISLPWPISPSKQVPWKEVSINLLDTPGHVDFTAEVERCLRVLDGAVVVFSAREGVEAQSETVWRQANRYHVPRIAFINKMDREGADFERTLEQMQRRLHANPVAIQIPVGAGPPHTEQAFKGIIDLISMHYLTFPKAGQGKEVVRSEIPLEWKPQADLWREAMLEKLYDYSNELMELALQEEEVPEELIQRVLREAALSEQIQPVLCGSALDGVGVPPLLDAVAAYLPSPADRPAVVGTDPTEKNQPEESRPPVADEPFCGLVFKVLPAKTGDMCWVRIYSGTLKANSRVYNPGQDKKENVAQLWRVRASRRDQIESAEAGDIIGIIGLRHSVTGDTICDTRHPILLEPIRFPETVLSMAIEPESAAERKKLAETLEMMKRQDPTFHARESEETGQTIISGMGELHLEVIQHRLLRDFRLDVKVHKPRVSYRESVDHAVEVVGECHRQLGGQQLFARVKIRMEPLGEGHGSDVQIANYCPPEKLPGSWRQTVQDELQARGQGGGAIGGFALMKVRVTVLDAEFQEGTSNDVAFRIAAADAFEQGLRQAGPVLLEPIMRLEITTPEEHLGDFVGDLQQRRGTIHHTESHGNLVTIEAHAPLAELFGYSSAMRSLSQGRAGCTMEPLNYQPAPANVVAEFAM